MLCTYAVWRNSLKTCFQTSVKVSLQHLFPLRSGLTVAGTSVQRLLWMLTFPVSDLSHIQSRDQLQSQVQAQEFFQNKGTLISLSTTCSLKATYWAASPYSAMQYIECIFASSGGRTTCTYLHAAADTGDRVRE